MSSLIQTQLTETISLTHIIALLVSTLCLSILLIAICTKAKVEPDPTIQSQTQNSRTTANEFILDKNITNLSQIPLNWSNESQVIRKDNRVTPKPETVVPTYCTFGPTLKTGIYKLTIVQNGVDIFLFDPSKGEAFPTDGHYSTDGRGIEINTIDHTIINSNGYTVGFFANAMEPKLTLELDLPANVPNKRQARLSINDKCQPTLLCDIPPTVRLALAIQNNSLMCHSPYLDFISFETLDKPSPETAEIVRPVSWGHPECAVNAQSVTPTTSETDYSKLPVHSSAPESQSVEGNVIQSIPGSDLETIVIDKQFTSGIHRITFEIVDFNYSISFGVVDPAMGFPLSGSEISEGHYGIDYRLSSGNFYTRNGELLSREFAASIGDTVTMELNLSDPNRSKHTLHFFVSNTQTPYYFHDLPEAVQFAFVIGGEGNAIKFVSLEEVPTPTSQSKADEVRLPFTSDVLYAPPEDDISDSDSYADI